MREFTVRARKSHLLCGIECFFVKLDGIGRARANEMGSDGVYSLWIGIHFSLGHDTWPGPDPVHR